MAKKNLLLKLAFVAALLALAGGGYGLYLWNLPHRDVRSAKIDYTLTAAELVDAYLRDAAAADAKYLDTEGDSRILALSGPVHSVRTNQNGETVVVLRAPGAKAGVTCTFTLATAPAPGAIQPGTTITVKGVIRAGAQYSDVLGTYVDAVVEKCSLL